MSSRPDAAADPRIADDRVVVEPIQSKHLAEGRRAASTESAAESSSSGAEREREPEVLEPSSRKLRVGPGRREHDAHGVPRRCRASRAR